MLHLSKKESAADLNGQREQNDRTLNGQVEVLKDLALALLREVETLRRTDPPDVRRGINFYEEIKRFEVDLIRRALARTGGHQTRAARLLGIKLTTLNHKIKRYNIDLDSLHMLDEFVPHEGEETVQH
jgi:transcriptional regulator with GAF, ATPase, and Fis domain